MSALGQKIAIVSLGHSCQTSRQIDAHVGLLRRLTGDAGLERATLPFDWLISSANGVRQMFDEGAFFPETSDKLCIDHGRVRLRDREVLYWHENGGLARAGHEAFAEAQGKFRFTAGRLDTLAEIKRVVAVISDTQPNLPAIEPKWGLRLTDTSPEEADATRDALARFLGRSVELIFVSRNPRPELSPRPGFAYYHMVPERGGWAGNKRHWAAVFSDYFQNPATQVEGWPLNKKTGKDSSNMDNAHGASAEMAAAVLTQVIVGAAAQKPSGQAWDEKSVLETYRRCFRYVRTISADPRYQI